MGLADDLRAAIDKVNAEPYWFEPEPIHPRMHDAINDLLGREHGTPITLADRSRAVEVLWERSDEAGRARLFAAAFGLRVP